MIKMQPLYGLVALFIILCFVHSCSGNAGRKTVVVFQGEKTDVPYKGKNNDIKVRQPGDFSVPAFVGAVLENNKEFLAVICRVVVFDSSDSSVHIEGVVKTSYGNNNIWSGADIFTSNTKTSATRTIGEDFTAVMKNNKIYVLVTSASKVAPSSGEQFDYDWDPLMFVGTIIDSTGSDVIGKTVKWEEGISLKDKLANDLKGVEVTKFFGGVGNGVVTKSGAIVFPIYMDQPKSQMTSSILYSTDNGSNWQIGKKTEDSTYDGSIVEWGDDKLLYIVSSTKGYRRVFESANMGTHWSESLMLSGVWGSKPNRNDNKKQASAIKVPVDGKNVLLFAHPLTTKGGSSADTLQLWLSDGQRIMRIGTISEEDKEQHSGNSILANIGNHLYITHEINPNGVWDGPEEVEKWSSVIGLTSLPLFFESAKATARAWKKLDEWFLSKEVPKDALVGFLGTAKDKAVWNDMYNCVNATVTGGESVSGGFKFNAAAGSGAQWPVQSQGQNQVYIFTEKQFTLAATVTIHTTEENGEFSLIGASLDSDGNNVLLGLGYTNDNKWIAVSHEKQQTTTKETFERNKEYHIALTFTNGAAAVYVDGKNITNNELKIQSTLSINHFYMGGMGESSTVKGSSCTVKNVMLFNRALGKEEIDKFKEATKNDKLGEPPLEALPIFIPENGISESQTTSTTTPVINQPVPTTISTTGQNINKPVLKIISTAIPDNGKSVQQTQSTLPDKIKYLLTTSPNTASISSGQTVTNTKAYDENMNKFQHEINEGVFQKETKDGNGAVVSLSAFGLMCFVCSFIAITGL